MKTLNVSPDALIQIALFHAMPKKMGTNTKAVEARARKEEKKRSENEAKQKEIDDAYWKDDDKNSNKKAQRKDDKEAKRLQLLEKKRELQELHDKEMSDIKIKKEPVAKVTHFQLEEAKKKQQEAAGMKPKVIEEPIPENVNKIVIEGDVARNIDEALKILTVEEKPDRHTEKRVKAAYLAFEDKRLPELKAENPGLRMSQLKQILSKEFEKSADNPKNQSHVSYNFKPQKSVPSIPE